MTVVRKWQGNAAGSMPLHKAQYGKVGEKKPLTRPGHSKSRARGTI